ncbi:MAG: hypothetical protein WBQ86_22525 [Candidatus Binatus sp.]
MQKGIDDILKTLEPKPLRRREEAAEFKPQDMSGDKSRKGVSSRS